MSSHRAARTDRRDTGHRRIAVATTASAVGGTALAVLFGTVLAHGTTPAAPATAKLVDAAQLAPAAVSAPDNTVDDVNAAATPTPHPTAVKSHRGSPTTTLKPPPSTPTKAPEATRAPTHASTGAS